jgi:hypothetical protein
MFDCGEMAQPTRMPVILTLTLSLRRGRGRIRGCISRPSGDAMFDCCEMAQPTRIPVILTLTLSLRGEGEGSAVAFHALRAAQDAMFDCGLRRFSPLWMD